ncbi:MAG: D-glycero-beta-D-manno-heptose-7-phosphate kinase [Janthinobacterium lividum]
MFDFSRATLICVGDIMLDRFVYGDVHRISPEAPVPVLRGRHTTEMLGGVGNVAKNVASLGSRSILIGLIGSDDSGARVTELLGADPLIKDCSIVSPGRATTCKIRYIAGNQQVLRADQEDTTACPAQDTAQLLAAVEAVAAEGDAVILGDYSKGVLSPGLIADIMAVARRHGLPVFVDPKSSDFSIYRGAACITPNLKELARAHGAPLADEAAIAAAAQELIEVTDAEAILVTRSEKGMMLVERGGNVDVIPSRVREVFDVSGAGDTVIATMAVCRAVGLPLSQAMRVANAAAGVVVGKVGTATASLDEVMAEMNGSQGGPATPAPGLLEMDRARALVARWRADKLRVGFTNGCFDILHAGHVALLSQARAACDRLIVALNTDNSVRRLKGATRPINTLENRARVIGALRDVDCVVSFDQDTPLAAIEALAPDVLVKGADYTADSVVGGDFVRARGGSVVLAALVDGQSTTGLVQRMRGVGTSPRTGEADPKI